MITLKNIDHGVGDVPLNRIVGSKVDYEYYVMDGNHRVSAAKGLGHTQILAKAVELIPLNNICCGSKKHSAQKKFSDLV